MSEIDVSKCEDFEKATCFDNDFDEIEFDYCKLFDEPCEDVRNNNRCTYKLKQQIQQLKATNELLRKYLEYERKCKEDFQDKWRDLYDENEKLKEEIDGLKRNILEKENCSPRYYLVTTHREWNELYKKFNYQREQKSKYKQCLDEIEETIKDSLGSCYTCNSSNSCMNCDKGNILKLIKQAKEGGE